MSGSEQVSQRIHVGGDFTGTPDQLDVLRTQFTELFAVLGGRAVDSQTSPPETYPPGVLNDRLELSLSWLMQDVGHSHRDLVKGMMGVQGIVNVRDILMFGEMRLRVLFPGLIADKTVERIRSRLAQPPLPVALLLEPSLEYVANLCDDLSQVPVQLVLGHLLSASDLKCLRSAGFTDLRITAQDAFDNTNIFQQAFGRYSESRRKDVQEWAEKFWSAKGA